MADGKQEGKSCPKMMIRFPLADKSYNFSPNGCVGEGGVLVISRSPVQIQPKLTGTKSHWHLKAAVSNLKSICWLSVQLVSSMQIYRLFVFFLKSTILIGSIACSRSMKAKE